MTPLRNSLFALSTLGLLSCTGLVGEGYPDRIPQGTAETINLPPPGAPGGGPVDPANPPINPTHPELGLADDDLRADCEIQPVQVGNSTLRRLTRVEYNNTIRDLLGIDTNPAENISADGKLGPFDSNVVPITELVADQYMRVAEDLALLAAQDPSHIVPCSLSDAACPAQFVAEFGRRAFRRPLDSGERDRYLQVYDLGAQTSDADGVRLVVQAMLQSPYFVYHIDPAADQGAPGEVIRLDPYRLASRLSYFLWSSMPDDPLMAAAASGTLDADLQTHVDRMLADPRASETIARFHLQWLMLDEAGDLTKDTTLFPQFDAALSEAMRTETAEFVNHVIRDGDGRLETLLTADYSFLEQSLADLYGVQLPPDHDPQDPVALDSNERAGLLTHGSFLATHAHPNQTSPVPRGIVVRKSLMCQTLPSPPEDLDTTLPEVAGDATTRERFEAHVSSAECSGCHRLIDGIGLGFEGYDAIGAYRDFENGLPVDASGEMVDSRDIDGEFDGVVELAGKLATSGEVRDCVTTQWFAYALGRPDGPEDLCSLVSAYRGFAAEDFNIRTLITSIVESDAFQYVRVPDPSEPSI